jgi:hypothetical protein
MRVPVLLAPVPHRVAHGATAVAAGAALGVPVRVAVDAGAGCDVALDGDGAEAAADVPCCAVPCWALPCCEHPVRATASVAVSTAGRAPRLMILRGVPIPGSFDDSVPYGRRTGSAG